MLKTSRLNRLWLSVTLFLAVTSFFALNVTPAQSSEIELKFAHFVPPNVDVSVAFDEWAKKVEENTNGKVKVTIYPAESLAKAKEMVIAPLKGICDISFMSYAADPTRFPLGTIMDLPAMGWPSWESTIDIANALHEKFPEMRDEFKGLKLLWSWASLGRQIHTTKKLVRTPEDVKGMRLAAGSEVAVFMGSLGANAVSLMPPDWYMSLERGVVEGLVEPYGVLVNHKVYPLTPYHTEGHFGLVGFNVIVNEAKWNSLPADVKEEIEKLSPWAARRCIEIQRARFDEGIELCKKEKHTIVKLNDAELQQWQDALEPYIEKWIGQREAKGLPAREVYNTARQLIQDYNK